MPSLGRLAGELTIDHTDSPGIPADLAAKWSKMGVAVAGPGVKVEMATYTCRHCNAVVLMRPERTRPREVCRKCMAVVCDKCVAWCEPFEKIAEAIVEGKFHRLGDTPLLVPLTS